MTVSEGQQIKGELTCVPNARNPRDLDITIAYTTPRDGKKEEIKYKMCVPLRPFGLSFSGVVGAWLVERTLTNCQVLMTNIVTLSYPSSYSPTYLGHSPKTSSPRSCMHGRTCIRVHPPFPLISIDSIDHEPLTGTEHVCKPNVLRHLLGILEKLPVTVPVTQALSCLLLFWYSLLPSCCFVLV